MNFEPLCQGLFCYKSFFFRPIQYSILGKLGSTRTNLVSTACGQNIMAVSKGFSLGVVKKRFLGKSTFEHKATKSGHKLSSWELLRHFHKFPHLVLFSFIDFSCKIIQN